MVLTNEHYKQYTYHYKNEYPIYIFIKNKKKKKNKKYMKNKENIKIKYIKDIKDVNDMHEKEIYESNIDNTQDIRKYEILTINYYNNYKNDIYYRNNKTINENYEKIQSISNENNKINISNAEIIYSYYNIYEDFLKSIKSIKQGSDNYKEFKLFLKQNYMGILECTNSKSTISFYKKIMKCYNLIKDVYDEITDKNKIIILLSMLRINVDILYKLNPACLYKLKIFLKDKCKENNGNNIIYKNVDEKYKISEIQKICQNIPISYIGSKRKMANEILNVISLDDM